MVAAQVGSSSPAPGKAGGAVGGQGLGWDPPTGQAVERQDTLSGRPGFCPLIPEPGPCQDPVPRDFSTSRAWQHHSIIASNENQPSQKPPPMLRCLHDQEPSPWGSKKPSLTGAPALALSCIWLCSVKGTKLPKSGGPGGRGQTKPIALAASPRDFISEGRGMVGSWQDQVSSRTSVKERP